MTTDTVQFTVAMTITPGKFDAFEAIAQALVAVSRKEAGTLAYQFCLSGDRKRCRLLEKYVDANAVLAHLTGPAVGELVPKLLEVVTVTGFEVYGDPGAKASEILAGLRAEIFTPSHGFSR